VASENLKIDQEPHQPEEEERFEVRSRDRVLVRKLDLEALHQPQGPTTGINAIIGKWPGDESEEEILALLEEMS
jgi:hypothetical protein